jgi:hypothetical protein
VVNSAPVIQAVDATGVTQLMQNHGETIARQVGACPPSGRRHGSPVGVTL